MRTSLAVKLTLAFLLTAVTAVALVALVVWLNSPAQLSRLLVEQGRSQLRFTVIDYYQQYGTLDGLYEVLRAQRPRPPGGPEAGTPPAEPAQPQQLPLRPQPGPLPQGLFGLVDAAGRVILPVSPESGTGDTLPPERYQDGDPLVVDGATIGYILTRPAPPEFSMAERAFLQNTGQALLLGAAGGVLLALVLGVLLARSLTRPLDDLAQAADRISSGQLEQQVAVSSTDELGRLAQSFNHMSQEVARANRLRRQMTSDIAHDLRTPLTIISGYIESIRDGVLEPTPQRLGVIASEIDHLLQLVSDLRTLAQTDAGELALSRQPCLPADLLERTAASYQDQAGRKGIHLLVNAPLDLPPVSVDITRMTQVLGNLAANALRFTPSGGEIRLTARLQGEAVLLAVQDTGQGIAPEDLPNIFSRLYRGDKSRSGGEGESGLGLAIARALVEAHGGKIRAESQLGEGTTISIILPQA